MTRERREEVVLVALVISVAVHAGLMLTVRSQVMTRPAAVVPPAHRETMRLTKAATRADPVKLAEILDLEAAKDAPAAVQEKSVPRVEVPAVTAAAAAQAPELDLESARGPDVARPVFEVKRIAAKSAPEVVRPIARIETPKVSSAAPSLPASSALPDLGAARAPAPRLAALPDLEAASVPPSPISRTAEPRKTETFKPAQDVYDRVDAKVVAEEKRAVRELVDAPRAEDLAAAVDLKLATALAHGARYFKVTVAPKRTLKVVPKDVVMVIDGSGSIGNDRLSSCRKAARRILRSCTNTGDRFNLVVFRNAFSYAFRAWQDCDAPGFAAGDKWLGRQTAHGRTDVFDTISSVLTLPRDPARPLVALVVTDGDANAGVSDTAEILSKFTALNDGLVSVYMYGVKSSANRELIDVLTHGNRGESFIFDGWRWNAGDGMEPLSERFRDPVLSDLRVTFAAGTEATAYPRLLRNLYRGQTLSFVGRVPADAKDVAFSLKGLNGSLAYEGFFRLPLAAATDDPSIPAEFAAEEAIHRKLK